MHKLIAIAGLIALSTGCLSGTVTVHSSAPAHQRLFSYTSYEDIQRVKMGSAMVYKIDGMVGEGFVATTSYQPEPDEYGELRFSRIEAGSEWLVRGRTSERDYLCESFRYPDPILGGFPVLWRFCLVVNESGEPYGYAPCSDEAVSIRAWPKKPDNFLKKQNLLFMKGSFKQELVYESKQQDTVVLSYHEYQDDLKQPLITQQLVFDLSESRDVGFKGLHLEVVEATLAHIRFIVKTPFD